MNNDIFTLVFTVIGVTAIVYAIAMIFLKAIRLKEWKDHVDYRIEQNAKRHDNINKSLQTINGRLSALENSINVAAKHDAELSESDWI